MIYIHIPPEMSKDTVWTYRTDGLFDNCIDLYMRRDIKFHVRLMTIYHRFYSENVGTSSGFSLLILNNLFKIIIRTVLRRAAIRHDEQMNFGSFCRHFSDRSAHA